MKMHRLNLRRFWLPITEIAAIIAFVTGGAVWATKWTTQVEERHATTEAQVARIDPLAEAVTRLTALQDQHEHKVAELAAATARLQTLELFSARLLERTEQMAARLERIEKKLDR